MEPLAARKGMRLKGYDYSRNGAYFITFCTKERRNILGSIVGRGILDAPYVELSEYGTNLHRTINFINQTSDTAHIDKYVIMPNHVHLIVVIHNDRPDGASGMPRPTNAVVPKLISSIKRRTNKLAGCALWQTSYHDHIIRNETDYHTVWNYIDTNPARWAEDKYYVP